MEKKEREKLEKRLIKTMESKLDTYPLAIENSVYEVLEVIMPTIEVELDKAREGELEWILKNCSGGGNWRRIVNQRLSKLKDNK